MPAAMSIDGNFGVPYEVSPPRFSQPFDGDAGAYVLEQDFWIHENYFQSLPLNTPHESVNGDPGISYPSYVLVKEGPTSKVGNGIVSWTRTYAALPASRDDWSRIAYTFIGFVGVLTPSAFTPGAVIGRPRTTAVVECRIQNDYFITLNNVPKSVASTVGSGSVASSVQPITQLSGVALLNDPSAIPSVPKQSYIQAQGTWSGSTFVPFYTDPVEQVLHGLPLGGIWDTSGGNFPISGVTLVPIPSRTQYDAWVAAGQEIVAEDSTVARWMGNIYVRQTKYVVAK